MTRAWGSKCDPWIDAIVKWGLIDESPATTKGVKTMTEHKLPFPAPAIKRVIFNAPATIILWEDGSKTVVKAHNEAFDPEKGLAMAVCKRIYGGKYHSLFKKWCPEEKAADEAPADPPAKKEFVPGCKVRFVGGSEDEYHPPVGTVGTIRSVNNEDKDCYVQWPEGSTIAGGGDDWYCLQMYLEVVE